jgi:flagellar motor switch protein FliN/FliY
MATLPGVSNEAALKEGEPSVSTPGQAEVVAKIAEFPELSPLSPGPQVSSLNSLLDVKVTVTVELGRTVIPIAEILKLNVGSVLELDRLVSEPVDIMVQGVRFARGEVVVVDDRFGIRLKEIADSKPK